jgi:hypothetical protein
VHKNLETIFWKRLSLLLRKSDHSSLTVMSTCPNRGSAIRAVAGAKLPLYTFRRRQIANVKNNAYSNGDSHKVANGDTALHNYELHELSQGLVENSEAANGFLDSLLLAQVCLTSTIFLLCW